MMKLSRGKQIRRVLDQLRIGACWCVRGQGVIAGPGNPQRQTHTAACADAAALYDQAGGTA